LSEVGPDEYVVITNRVGKGKISALYELGLTVTGWCDSDEVTKGQEKEGVAVFISQKEDAKSIWRHLKYHERTWSDCVIYQDLEKDAAHCMRSYIPRINEKLISLVMKNLKYIREEYKYTVFYQAVRYAGLFGKYDQNNCVALCLVCKQELSVLSKKRGDLPILYPSIDGTGSLNSPVVVYTMCLKCAEGYEKRKTISDDLIRKEINFILHSKDTRWVQNHRKVKSPFDK
jgi:hypothetical protein